MPIVRVVVERGLNSLSLEDVVVVVALMRRHSLVSLADQDQRRSLDILDHRNGTALKEGSVVLSSDRVAHVFVQVA